jgi:hypothetical protein
VGISPRKVSASGGERKTSYNGKALALVLDDGGRELQGVESTRSSSNGHDTASASSS